MTESLKAVTIMLANTASSILHCSSVRYVWHGCCISLLCFQNLKYVCLFGADGLAHMPQVVLTFGFTSWLCGRLPGCEEKLTCWSTQWHYMLLRCAKRGTFIIKGVILKWFKHFFWSVKACKIICVHLIRSTWFVNNQNWLLNQKLYNSVSSGHFWGEVKYTQI